MTDLETRLRSLCPAIRFVRERHVRKVLHRLVEAGDEIAVNTELPIWVGRAWIDSLGLIPSEITAGDDERLLLVTDPSDRTGVTDFTLVARLVNRAVVADELFATDDDVIEEKFTALGIGVEAEARFILEQDHVVPYGCSRRLLYRMFVAMVVDLIKHDPSRLGVVFPILAGEAQRVGLLLDGFSGFEIPVASAARLETVVVGPVGGGGDSAWVAAVQGRGNFVRAAILHTQAGNAAAARAAIEVGIVRPLAARLDWDEAIAATWLERLVDLLPKAAIGTWPAVTKGLYHLQRIPRDLGRGLSVIDPVEWLRSFGSRPVRRLIPRAEMVVLVRHLTAARRQLDGTPLAGPLDDEIHRADAQVRDELTPIVVALLEEVEFRPTDLPGRIARDKLVAELLDRACERGQIRFGDLRDAVSRNDLKMPDLAGPRELLRGDALMNADKRLAVELDGVYRRGELYLRWLHRGTAVAFGTRIGRWLSRYVVLPFGGAFLTVEFAKYVALEVAGVARFLRNLLPKDEADDALVDLLPVTLPDETTTAAAPAADAHGIALTPELGVAIAILGLVYLGLLYWPAFRSVVVQAVFLLGRGLRIVAIDGPRSLWQSEPLRALRDHPITRSLVAHFGTAFLVAVAMAIVLILMGSGPGRVRRWSGITFFLVAGITHTALGRRVEDDLITRISDFWRAVRRDLIPGVVSWVTWIFRQLGGAIERGLYSVDEWFRYRDGDPGLGVKIVLAAVWFPIAYVVRFVFMLLFEPQVNPLKHFPVVTVSHKLLLPLIGVISNATGLSTGVVTGIIACVPGIFGFIAWEIKENWRLYLANRPGVRPPIVLGHHGETMRGLLRPGFHSGTVPKLFRQLRAGKPAAVRGLADVRHAVEVAAERELVPLLTAAGMTGVHVAVRLRVLSVEVAISAGAAAPLRLVFTVSDGQVEPRIASEGWLPGPDGAATAIESFAALCGAELRIASPPTNC